MNELILAIDQGTSGTKSVLFDRDGQIFAKGYTESESLFPQPGFVEQDPGQIYQNMLDSVTRCLADAEEKDFAVRDRVKVVGISNQRETFLLWDKKGLPLCNAIVWQCKRSVSVCERLKNTALEAEIKSRTGLIVDPYFSGAKLTWMMENCSDIKNTVSERDVYFGTIDTWLLYKLTDGQSYFTDITNASRTLLFNIHTLQWDDTLIKGLGVEGIHTPDVKPSSYKFGFSDFEGRFREAIPINSMIGDSHGAAFGEGCLEPGQAKATLGTGSSILWNTGQKPVTSGHGMVTTTCWSTPDRLDYALEGIIVTCGATIKWLRDQIGLFTSSSETEKIAQSLENNGGVYLIPAFSGMGAPYWKMDAHASIVGLTFGVSKDHIVRAALESVAYQIKDVVSAMEKDSGIVLSELKVDGGMVANHWLMQKIADLLGVRISTIGIEEVSALGAAYMAGLEFGLYKSLDELAAMRSSMQFFEPNPDSKDIRKSHAIWQTLVNKHC
ncbi:MAG: glycerol kinase GlpK [Desulfobulbaceae bacterium]|nr:MAG: glycerol kinase GlpK [Desulfobulbaceae bacterium]